MATRTPSSRPGPLHYITKTPEISRLHLESTFRRLPSVVISFPLLGLVVTKVLEGQIPSDLLRLWMVALCSASVFSLAACWTFARFGDRGDDRLWSLLRVACSCYNGLTFGLAGTLLFVPGNVPLQAFMLLLIAGAAAVAVTSSSAHFISLLVYLSCSILPAAVRLFLEGAQLPQAMGLFALIYTAVLVGIGVSSNRLETRTAGLTLENRRLIADLEDSNQELNLRVVERTSELEELLEVVRRSQSELSRFHALLDHSGVGVFVAEPETLRIVDYNQAACQLLHRDSEQIQGQSLPSLELSAELARAETWKELLASRSNQFVSLEERPDGSTQELSVAYQEFEGSPYAVVVIRDATERRQMEAQLRSSQKMEAIGKLAGGIAHDFNNILTAVIGLADMIVLENPPDSTSHKDALSIVEAGKRASDLTKKLLALTRSGLEQRVTLDVNEAVRDLFKMLRRTFSQDIELVSLLSEAACPVRIVPGELDQILLNLAFNARDAMPSGGVLTVEVERSGDSVTVDFSDTGTGISPDVKEKIFDPFFTTKGQMGHGLGLSTCFGLLTRAGGQISVSSEIGKGTRFRVVLPLDTSEQVDTPVRAKPAGDLELGCATILVVEDQEAVLKMVSRHLKKHSYTVVQARSAEEAWALYGQSSEPFDLVLTDIILPGLSGVDLCREIGRDGPRLMLMSGYTEQAPELDEEEALPLLAKPFTLEELLRKVQETLASTS